MQAQLSFSELLVPVAQTGQPMTPAQKLQWLAENTKLHRISATERTDYLAERVQELNQRKNTE